MVVARARQALDQAFQTQTNQDL